MQTVGRRLRTGTGGPGSCCYCVKGRAEQGGGSPGAATRMQRHMPLGAATLIARALCAGCLSCPPTHPPSPPPRARLACRHPERVCRGPHHRQEEHNHNHKRQGPPQVCLLIRLPPSPLPPPPPPPCRAAAAPARPPCDLCADRPSGPASPAGCSKEDIERMVQDAEKYKVRGQLGVGGLVMATAWRSLPCWQRAACAAGRDGRLQLLLPVQLRGGCGSSLPACTRLASLPVCPSGIMPLPWRRPRTRWHARRWRPKTGWRTTHSGGATEHSPLPLLAPTNRAMLCALRCLTHGSIRSAWRPAACRWRSARRSSRARLCTLAA